MRGNRLALPACLMACQQTARGIGRFEQHIHHGRYQAQLMAAQAVEQRLHLVRELGHVGKAEGGGAALDGMGAAEDAVELLVIGRVQIQMQQHLLHLVQVLGSFLEEDLIELRQVEICACVLLMGVRHGVGFL